jgi:hypothetical protein
VRILFTLTLAAIALAGCSQKPLEVDRITPIKANNGSTNTDIYADRRKSGEKVPELSGDQIVAVRTYIAKKDDEFGLEKELAGANCILTARDFSAKVKTPAKVRLPLYHLQSSTISVHCEKDGYKPRTIDHAVYNKTKDDRYKMANGNGVLAVIAVAAINGMSDEKTHDFQYPLLRVALKPLDDKKK